MTNTMTDGHMGWSNRSTWNANLWLTNTESLYKLMGKIAAGSKSVSELADNMEGFLVILWKDRTPDGDSLDPVDWVQISEAWAEANQLFDYKPNP